MRLLGILAVVACVGGSSTDRPTAEAPCTLRIVVTVDAKLYADGRAVTLTGLDSLLTALKVPTERCGITARRALLI